VPKIIIAGNVSQAFKDKMAAKIAFDVRVKFVGVPDTPLVRVIIDGVDRGSHTSLYSAKCYAEHVLKTEDAEHEAEEPPCDCYGCTTMRHPCVKEVR
jgi:hypothetical protein